MTFGNVRCHDDVARVMGEDPPQAPTTRRKTEVDPMGNLESEMDGNAENQIKNFSGKHLSEEQMRNLRRYRYLSIDKVTFRGIF